MTGTRLHEAGHDDGGMLIVGESYQAPKSLTLRLVVIVMAGGGPSSTFLLITAGKDVDADLRRHDDSAATRGSS
jgi:hypothetical protein